MEKSCLNCKAFAWWDGDYCCTKKMKLLCNAPNGDFTSDILSALKINKNCESYEQEDNEEIINLHKEIFDTFLRK